MTDEMNLTQTLGGLRIANPDDTPISPSSPTSKSRQPSSPIAALQPISSHSSYSSNTVTNPITRSVTQSDNSWPADINMDPSSPNAAPRSVPYMQDTSAYPPANVGRLSHRQSMPIAHQAQQQMQYTSHPTPTVLNQPRSYGPLTARPTSGIYNHPNVSGGSQSSAYSAYRYGDDPPQQIAPPHRTSSRATPGVATRNSEYANSNQLPPPRRSSRRISPGTVQPATPGAIPSSSSYVENGPLHSSEEWKDKGAAVGIRREVDSEGRTITKVMKKGVKDFDFGRTLGEGSYSTVLAATDRTTLREYAIKVLDKRHIIKEKKVKYVNIEKDTLNRLNSHPGIVRLYYTFQDERSLYFVLDLAANGELLATLKKIGTFDEECTRFYGAQILDAISYMHSRGVLHRDLKPENVLLDDNMHIKITDFGTGKILEDKKTSRNGPDIVPGSRNGERSASFVGTAEYVSPELLTNKEGGKPTDLWAFGCVIYQLLTGRPPFKGATEYLTFEKILALDYTFPPGFPTVARDLVERLLVPEPTKRLTVEHVMNHDFFQGVHWGAGLWKQKAPRLKPYVPPPPEPIRLNGHNGAIPNSIPQSQSTQHRPQTTRLITELPAPSQLDIEWSPVLTRSNERILKLGNLVVTVSAQQGSPNSRNGDATSQEAPRKFHRFFLSGATTKKRQRLVMVTSSGRIILAASGGDEKKAKLEIPLLMQDTTWRNYKDGKGLTVWCIDTKDKHILFEPPLSPPPEPDGTAIATSEWLDSLNKARDLGFTYHSLSTSYSNDPSSIADHMSNPNSQYSSQYNSQYSSQMPSPAAAGSGGERDMYLNDDGGIEGVDVPRERPLGRDEERESLRKGRKRFSRRQSKGGLAAVF